MAHYLILNDSEPPIGLVVEAKNVTRAIETHGANDGDKLVVYRIADGPKKVHVRSETVKRIEIE